MVLLETSIKTQIAGKNSFRELLTLSAELNVLDFYTMSIVKIKKKVVTSRLDYLTHKFSAHSNRNKHLQSTQQLHKLTTERMKIRYKNGAKTFGKSKSAAIKK